MKKSQTKRSPARKADRKRRSSVRMSQFAESLLREWKRLDLPTNNARVVVAVSGGADSVALLLALDELLKSKRFKLEFLVAHLNHRLRGKASDADARWVTSFAKQLGHKVAIGSVDVKRRAAKTDDNLEQAARRARYEFLAKKARRAKVVLTAHTMDDQAETVLLNLLRGSGASGLGGVEPVRPLSSESETLLARPLLSWARRRDTEGFCRLRGVDFLTDEMNLDEKFARVRVRRQLLPLMQTFNPKLVEGLTRTAELLREDSMALDQGASRLLELSIEADSGSIDSKKIGTLLRLDLLSLAPPALRRRALRLWIGRCRGDLKRLERVHIVALEKLLLGDRGGRVIELPGGARVARKLGLLQYIG
jgi:tRNA(Ile)-lysidine synthase